MTTTEQQTSEGPIRGTIDIERYAEVMAHVRHFGKPQTAEVLERLGLDEDLWEEALFGFTAVLVEESEREEEGLSRRFGERFAKTKTRLSKEKPALRSIGPRRDETPEPPPAEIVAPTMPIAAPELAPPPPMPMSPVVVPTPLQQTPLPTQEGVSPWAHGAAASTAAPPPIVPPRVVAPVKPTASPDMSFVPAGMRNFASLHGTQGPALDAAAKPALPFAEDAANADQDAAFRRAKELAETEPIRPKPLHAEPATGETRDISAVVAAVMAQKKSIPFEKDKQAAKTAIPAMTPPPAVVTPSPPPAVVVPNSPTKTPTAPNPEPISLTIEQYASLCVEIALNPTQRREITQRYGLSDEHASRIDAYWRARITNEPEIDKAFRWAYHSYQQWLARR